MTENSGQPQASSVPQIRAFAYIDGFNLYNGLKSAGFKKYYWLDLQKTAQMLLKPGQVLAFTKYFTTRASGAKHGDNSLHAQSLNDQRRRQNEYLEALGTLLDFEMYYGQYQDDWQTCLHCKKRWMAHEEKMTDVNIATQILVDAFDDRFDLALLLSGDSDLVPPLKVIKSRFPKKRIISVFPPQRVSRELQQVAHGYMHVNETILRACQLPDKVTRRDGFILRRPKTWV